MKNSTDYWISMMMVLLLPTTAAALFIDVQFIGAADISGFETWNWGEGSPMPNQEMERAARATIERLMTAKGYAKVQSEADCHIALHAEPDEWFDGGLFKIEALDGKTGKPVWRGKAEGAVNVQGPAKRQKLVVRTTKKMFKKFPARRRG